MSLYNYVPDQKIGQYYRAKDPGLVWETSPKTLRYPLYNDFPIFEFLLKWRAEIAPWNATNIKHWRLWCYTSCLIPTLQRHKYREKYGSVYFGLTHASVDLELFYSAEVENETELFLQSRTLFN